MRKIFEIGYLIIAIVFLVEAYLNWGNENYKHFIYLIFATLAVFMYFFRKKFRKKMENKQQ
jgi:hypothetical protein